MHRKFITTPIYYVNDLPHIGHMYTTVLADTIARYNRMMGYEVYFLTGTDEYGQKIEKTALAKKIEPNMLVDQVSLNFKQLWAQMQITNNYFVRTTDNKHLMTVQNIFQQLLEKKDIYKSMYTGLYSINDESYVTATQAKELKNDSNLQLVELKEESYFFRLSNYQNWLVQLYNEMPFFVQPLSRFNEVKQFVASNNGINNLQDLSISRTSVKWGIPVPGDASHVIYVWFDALINYLSAAQDGFWPPSIQVVGKDILRFHAIYWPAILMSIFRDPDDDVNGVLPKHVIEKMPKNIIAHGWWLMANDKISKSKGNVINSKELLQFGNDAVRFFFLRAMQIGADRQFAIENFIDYYNSDLANGIGNLVSRILSMLHRYCGGIVPTIQVLDESDKNIFDITRKLIGDYICKANKNEFHEVVNILWSYISKLDAYIVKAEPWKLIKEDRYRIKVDTVLSQLYVSLKLIAVLLNPILPNSAQKIWSSLGLFGNVDDQKITSFQYEISPNTRIFECFTLFKRIDKDTTMTNAVEKNHDSNIEKIDINYQPLKDTINYEHFAKLDLRVGKILSAERVANSTKLIKMIVDIGVETRVVVGGIGVDYAPNMLVGLNVIVLVNLMPRKIMGIMSYGMILAINSHQKNYLISPSSEANVGDLIS